MFENGDLKDFWNRHEYYTENYVEEPLTDEIIAFYENRLGLKFPQSYIQLMKTQNGGHPKKSYWFNEYARRNEINTIGLAGFFGIGSTSTTLYLENLEMNFGLMNGNIHEIQELLLQIQNLVDMIRSIQIIVNVEKMENPKYPFVFENMIMKFKYLQIILKSLQEC